MVEDDVLVVPSPVDVDVVVAPVGGGHRLRIACGVAHEIASTSTSQPFDVGMPVPSVPPPMSRHVGGP